MTYCDEPALEKAACQRIVTEVPDSEIREYAIISDRARIEALQTENAALRGLCGNLRDYLRAHSDDPNTMFLDSAITLLDRASKGSDK